MNDLIERLRAYATEWTDRAADVKPVHDAIARISSLEAENKRLREALKSTLPILDAVRYSVGLRGNQLDRIERARAALQPNTSEDGAK